jgi:hypothetical protein
MESANIRLKGFIISGIIITGITAAMAGRSTGTSARARMKWAGKDADGTKAKAAAGAMKATVMEEARAMAGANGSRRI